MVLAEISIKLIILPNRKESSVPLLVVQMHLMAPMICLRAFTSSSLCTEEYMLSIYRSILILFSVNIMDEGDYCCKISTNFLLGT